MKLVMTLVVRDDADVLDAQLAFHLHAGVDFVIATDHDSRDGSAEILESYAREGCLRRLTEQGEAREAEWVNAMARLAVSDGADWVIDARPGEFWWPRGESLQDVLVAVPPRYAIVQGLVRVFVPRPDDAAPFFADRMVIRRTPVAVDSGASEPLPSSLRPIFRAGPGMTIRSGPEPSLSGRVPLRAWYPVEVLHFPVRSGEPYGELAVDGEKLSRGLEEGALVVDERLRDALHVLRPAAGQTTPPGREFLLPAEAPGRLAFPTPDIVDDAAYAVDCAAVGEVDLARHDRHIRDLEDRIAWLEDRLWPRLLRTLSRLVHPPGR